MREPGHIAGVIAPAFPGKRTVSAVSSTAENQTVNTSTTPPADRRPRIQVLAMPADTNPAGNIFGGWIMSQMDIAGGLAASEQARGGVATVAVNSMEFHKPVYVGDVISCYAEVTRTGHSSVTVDVQVYARRVRDGEEQWIEVTGATIVYVALTDGGLPRPVALSE